MANYNSIAEFNQALANAKTLLPAMMLPLVNTSDVNFRFIISLNKAHTANTAYM